MNNFQPASDGLPLASLQHGGGQTLRDAIKALRETSRQMSQQVYEISRLINDIEVTEAETEQLRTNIDAILEKWSFEAMLGSSRDSGVNRPVE